MDQLSSLQTQLHLCLHDHALQHFVNRRWQSLNMPRTFLHLNLFKNLLTSPTTVIAAHHQTETKPEPVCEFLQEQRKCQRWFSFSAGVWVIFCSQLNNSALRLHGRPASVWAGLSRIHSRLSSHFHLSRLPCWSCNCSGLSQSSVCCDATSVSSKLREYVAIVWGSSTQRLRVGVQIPNSARSP